MRLCLELAARAYGDTSPNPMVGAVIVRNGEIVGSGWHHAAGAPHAEIEAIRSLSGESAGAEMYVSLEPCCIQGRTPPCTEALIRSGIRRVVAASLDPNPRVAGRGIEALRFAGIQTEVGLLHNEARKLNEVFWKYIRTGFPFVTLKSALSLDGKIATATGKSQWISSAESRTDAHQLRKGADAVAVGIGTVIADDPSLTVRHVTPPRQQPWRIIFDTTLKISLTAKLVQKGGDSTRDSMLRTIVVTSPESSREKIDCLAERGVECLLIPPDQSGRIPLREAFRILGDRQITHVLIEGGPILAASAITERIVDKGVYYLAPKLIGGHDAPGALASLGISSPDEAVNLRELILERCGPDLKITGTLSPEEA
jgi:diaminohydroxyphosphoribosylaminopyrimidine deaminase / 5-amino-6-(5-phosphoribosylamino)uracil reductase